MHRGGLAKHPRPLGQLTATRSRPRRYGITNQSLASSLSRLSGGSVGSGKSGQLFYFSHDKRFIVKTLKGSEKDFFFHSKRGVLPAYCEHMLARPDTLLCRFYGLFKASRCHVNVTLPALTKTPLRGLATTAVLFKTSHATRHTALPRHQPLCPPPPSTLVQINLHDAKTEVALVVMNNALLSPLPIHLTYDLKGSTASRYVDGKLDPNEKVLKDLNFKSQPAGSETTALYKTHSPMSQTFPRVNAQDNG